MLTNKGKYGLKAMVHLAGLEPGSLAQAADIAEANTISKKFLDHILTDLCRAGTRLFQKGKRRRLWTRPAGGRHPGRGDRARPRRAARADRLRLRHRVSAVRRLR